MDPLLPLIIALPLLASVVLALAPAGLARRIALGFAFAGLALALAAVLRYDTAVGGLQFVFRYDWIPALGAEWYFGADGLGVLLVLLAGLLGPFALWMTPPELPLPRLFFALMSLLQAAALGVFLSLNFVVWFLFWELALIPAFFLIKLWGGDRAGPAAYQFFLYTMTGSIAMLLAFLALFRATGSFDFIDLAEAARAGELMPSLAVGAPVAAGLVFAGVFLGLAVKVPVVPFHTWLPDTYAEAPAGVSMILTGLLSKMGLYGMLRILLPLFPELMQAWMAPLLVLALASILLSALAALAQTDLKRILAYSSINHLGYCLLGLFAVGAAAGPAAGLAAGREAALAGVCFQMFSHGVTAATLFAFVAVIEARSGGLRGLHDFGGLRAAAPMLCGLMGVALFASIGLPGLSGFVGEFLIFKGAFGLVGGWVALALPGLLLTAGFLLRVLLRVFSGPLPERWQAFPDLTRREGLMLFPIVGLMVVLGCFPGLLLRLFHSGFALLP
ncbi:MAG: NADH-quinone oxidoreductase subunit M [Puniceicoccaceae bacterium]|nr:MAG: NADH-quinone oxidoreductase subunit M [Puniceicoccaceae bacterium]